MEKYDNTFENLSNLIRTVWNQTEIRLVLNQSENGIHNPTSVNSTRIGKEISQCIILSRILKKKDSSQLIEVFLFSIKKISSF